jgi:hypothetical protein
MAFTNRCSGPPPTHRAARPEEADANASVAPCVRQLGLRAIDRPQAGQDAAVLLLSL